MHPWQKLFTRNLAVVGMAKPTNDFLCNTILMKMEAKTNKSRNKESVVFRASVAKILAVIGMAKPTNDILCKTILVKMEAKTNKGRNKESVVFRASVAKIIYS